MAVTTEATTTWVREAYYPEEVLTYHADRAWAWLNGRLLPFIDLPPLPSSIQLASALSSPHLVPATPRLRDAID